MMVGICSGSRCGRDLKPAVEAVVAMKVRMVMPIVRRSGRYSRAGPRPATMQRPLTRRSRTA